MKAKKDTIDGHTARIIDLENRCARLEGSIEKMLEALQKAVDVLEAATGVGRRKETKEKK